MSGDKTAPVQTPCPPSVDPGAIKRAKILLILSSILLALWIAAMIAMYVTTVYPQRHPVPVTSAGK